MFFIRQIVKFQRKTIDYFLMKQTNDQLFDFIDFDPAIFGKVGSLTYDYFDA